MENNNEVQTVPAAKVKAPKAKVARKTAKKPGTKKLARAKKGDTIREQAMALLRRKEGATLPDLMKKFDWLPHTTRGVISILGRDHKVISEKVDGVRTYKLR
jgi:hypothetical protein